MLCVCVYSRGQCCCSGWILTFVWRWCQCFLLSAGSEPHHPGKSSGPWMDPHSEARAPEETHISFNTAQCDPCWAEVSMDQILHGVIKSVNPPLDAHYRNSFCTNEVWYCSCLTQVNLKDLQWGVCALVYLVIHDDHVSTEEVVMCNDSSEPLGGWVLSVHTHTVAIQRIGTWKQQGMVPLTIRQFNW